MIQKQVTANLIEHVMMSQGQVSSFLFRSMRYGSVKVLMCWFPSGSA